MRGEHEEQELYYQIPRNVIARFELIPGIGWKQIIIGGICFLFAVGFWKVTGFINIPVPIRLFFSIMLVGCPLLLSIPNPALGNICLFDRLLKAYKFSKSQKQYHFRKGD